MEDIVYYTECHHLHTIIVHLIFQLYGVKKKQLYLVETESEILIFPCAHHMIFLQYAGLQQPVTAPS